MLRGVSAVVALPWLEAMSPSSRNALAAGQVAGGPPLRMGFLYVPNGVAHARVDPQARGRELRPGPRPRTDQELSRRVLGPDRAHAAQRVRSRRRSGRPCPDVSPASSPATHPVKTDGANIKNGISVDQVAAQKLGHLTRLPSLELGCDRGAQSGSCDSGYSCAYSSNISWRSPILPSPRK